MLSRRVRANPNPVGDLATLCGCMDEKVGPVSHRWASAFSPLGSDCQATSDAAFSTFVRLRAQAVLLAPEVTILTERKRVAALAAAAHLPSIYSFRECVEEG